MNKIRRAAIRVRHSLACLALLSCVTATAMADTPPADTPYWRPAVHFTPQRNWMNDPNGLIHHHGVYHLFYQYNPFGAQWGNMSWGHATSKDLVHWKQLPLAIPNTPTEDVFSGSIVSDRNNTSGLGSASRPPLVAIYTSAFKTGSGHANGVQAQSLAYSIDDGLHWSRYSKNPVVTLTPESNNFRDPRVQWYAAGHCWLMAAVAADAHQVRFYRSPDLIHWEFLSDFGPAGIAAKGMAWEMPDFFSLPLDGDDARRKWVLVVGISHGSVAGGSGTQYFVGTFDGRRFRPDRPSPVTTDPSTLQWLDHGADNYASGTYQDAPDGRRVMMAWMTNLDYAGDVPTSPWRGEMVVPREITLRSIDGRPQLVTVPAKEFAAYVRRQPTKRLRDVTLHRSAMHVDAGKASAARQIDVTIAPAATGKAGIVINQSPDGTRSTRIYYDSPLGALVLDRSHTGKAPISPHFSGVHTAKLPLVAGKLRLTVIQDASSIEVFANDGRAVITDLVFPEPGDNGMSLFTDGETASFSDMDVIALKP